MRSILTLLAFVAIRSAMAADAPEIPTAWPWQPLTFEGEKVYTPLRQTWKPPAPQALPSAAELATTTYRDQVFTVTRRAGAVRPGEPADCGIYLQGTGGGGMKSQERAVIERCTFILDFAEGDFSTWDDRRCAVRIDGYREVVVRDCVFISRGKAGDPPRKAIGSVVLYDCREVLVENCYFEGLTNWMRGHVLAYCCGPTTVRRCEVSGGPGGQSGGGIWIANGLGEGKIGSLHQDEPELMMYPSGPALIEDCWLHDHQGKDNADGIYVQSVHNSLIRNCRVERWRMDGLMDVGYRDALHGYKGRTMWNHGALTVVENCAFAGGFLKNSVGAGGGTVLSGCRFDDVWLMPYIFDGGGLYVLGCDFVGLTGAVLTPSDGRHSGWTPKEGMLTNGARAVLLGNRFAARDGARLPSLYVGNGRPIRDIIVSDANVFALGGIRAFAEDRSAKAVIPDLAAWTAATGNDAHSAADGDPLQLLAALDRTPVPLPPGIAPPAPGSRAGLRSPAVGFVGEIGGPGQRRTPVAPGTKP